MSNFHPHFEYPATELMTGFRSSKTANSADVGVYIGYYRQQNIHSKLISSNNLLVVPKDRAWAQVANSFAQDTQGEVWETAEIRGTVLGDETANGRLRVWQIYWINGHLTSSAWRAKLYGALGRLAGQGDASAVIVLYAQKPVAGGNDALLAEFWRDNQAAVTAWLAQVDPVAERQSLTTLNQQGTSQ